jgi:RNA polymerase sigma-70 factor (ECF subfamily)
MLRPMTEGDDLDLVRRIASGDRMAMRALYGRHQLKVHRFITGMVRDAALAEDLVNDVFFDVWQQAGRFEARSTVSTWLLGIARFKALSARRKRRDDELDDETAQAVPDGADTPEVTAQKSDKGAALRTCIGRLSAEHRAVVDLVYYHDKSVEEVAVILTIPEATVKTRMFYARKKLSELMAAAGLDRGWP